MTVPGADNGAELREGGFAENSHAARKEVGAPGPDEGQSVPRPSPLPALGGTQEGRAQEGPSCCGRCGEQPASDPLPPDSAEPSRTQLHRPQLPHGLPARGEWAEPAPAVPEQTNIWFPPSLGLGAPPWPQRTSSKA